MKIIASITSDSFLVEMDKYELGRVQGVYKDDSRKVGDVICVSDIYSTAQTIASGDELLRGSIVAFEKTIAAIKRFADASENLSNTVKSKLK